MILSEQIIVFISPDFFQSIMPISTVTNYNKQFYIDERIPDHEHFGYDPLCGSIFEDYIRFSLRTNMLDLTFD